MDGDASPEFLRDYAYASKAAADVKYPQIAEAYLNTQMNGLLMKHEIHFLTLPKVLALVILII